MKGIENGMDYHWEIYNREKRRKIKLEEATELCREYISRIMQIRNAADLRDSREAVQSNITGYLLSNFIQIHGYDDIAGAVGDITEDICGFGPLSDAMVDSDITDIHCVDYHTIFVEHRQSGGEKARYPKSFRNPLHFTHFIERLLREAGKTINLGEETIVDFEIGEHRGNVTHPAISIRDYSLDIRKHGQVALTVDDLISGEVISSEMASFIRLITEGRGNCVIAGQTGSGKSTDLKVICEGFMADRRIIVCEDTRELNLANAHVVELVARKSENRALAVPLDRLVYTALRKKPDYIVIGEVRGPEAVGAVEAMETDHSTFVTLHAGGPHDVVNRLMEKYLTYVSGMNVTMALQKIARSVNFVIQKASNKRLGRKIVAITELGYDYRNHDIMVNPIFRYDFKRGCFQRVGAISERMQEKFLTKGADPEMVERFGRLQT